jgi:murein DD-endopeptidase MepM/ murein hydrolase activator NlpD
MISILRDHNFSQSHISTLLNSSKKDMEIVLVPGQKYALFSDKENKAGLKFYDPQTDKALVLKLSKKGQASAKAVEEDFITKIINIAGVVKGSLVASITKHLPDPRVAYRFMDAYLYQFRPSKVLQRGDKFKFRVEEKWDEGHFVKYGDILETKLTVAGTPYEKELYVFDKGSLFIGDIDMEDKRPLYTPVNTTRISSLFQRRRFHPVKKRYQAHHGVDYEIPVGSDIYAAANGKVLRFGRTRAAGRYVVIKHSGGLVSYYNHLSQISPNLKKNMKITSQTKIGEVGCTGYCTKPHLHFAVKKNGAWVDPLKYMKGYPAHLEKTLRTRLAKLKFD